MILTINRVFKHLKVKFRKKVFKLKTSTKHNNFTIHGEVNLFNSNVKVGNNVHIYPNATFWGDGDIVIGDNCSIGQGTVIFASKNGGGG